MNSYNNINWSAFYNEIKDLENKSGTSIQKEPNWWDFIKDAKFWIEVAKIIFKFIFKRL